ncbi:tyrosine-type recombinase/integrase [Vibrio sp. MarTm2]|uniref:tyrosine-type recombinase/integrase n=1 Tax=Vibrio sp. MarTm2 TaxID=2998831 RepID=UPI0022CD3E95|nr:tyrosine-type recombinase/integrase [Vibrio sp. MarTm2]MDA0128554.1 tyrosine-type recombinase/integrase [Vibrio sp. MarTm2]
MRESRILFRTAVKNYIDSEEFSELAKSTARGYMDAAKILVRHFSMVRIKDISKDDFTDFLKYHMDELTPSGKNGYSKRTRKNAKLVFKKIYYHHVERKLIKCKIDFSSILVTYGTARIPRVPYDKITIEKLRGSIEDRHDAWVFDLFELGTLTGMRVQELFGLSDSDVMINSEGKYTLSIKRAVVDHEVKSPKNKYSIRKIILSKKSENIVRRHLKDKKVLKLQNSALMENGERALLINYKKKQPWMSSVVYYRELKELFVSAGLKEQYRGLHPTRHTFVTNAINVGMPDDTISGYIGHSNTITMKKHYMHNSLIEQGRHSSSCLDQI